MRLFLSSVVVGGAFLSVALPALAQTPLSFDDAVRQALEHNPAIRQARARVDRAGAGVTEARAGWLPRVTFVEAGQRSDQPVFVFSSRLSARRFGAADFALDALNHPSATSLFRRAVALDQVLFDGGRTRASVRVAERERESADLSVRVTAAGLVVQMAERYGRLLAAEARARAADAGAAAAAEDQAAAERRRDVGRATDADVLAMSAHAADLRQRAIQAKGEAAVARAEINRHRGAPVTSAFDAVEPAPLPLAAADGVETLLRAAEDARPDVARAINAERIALEHARGARADWLPSMAGRVGYESTGLAFGDRASGWTAGLELQWSLSLGGAELARTRRAAAELAEARAAIEAAKADAGVDLVSARERQRTARARLEAGRAAVDAARESERITRDRYAAGLADVNALLRASALSLDAETARVDALVSAIVADAEFDRAAGRDPWMHR